MGAPFGTNTVTSNNFVVLNRISIFAILFKHLTNFRITVFIYLKHLVEQARDDQVNRLDRL